MISVRRLGRVHAMALIAGSMIVAGEPVRAEAPDCDQVEADLRQAIAVRVTDQPGYPNHFTIGGIEKLLQIRLPESIPQQCVQQVASDLNVHPPEPFEERDFAVVTGLDGFNVDMRFTNYVTVLGFPTNFKRRSFLVRFTIETSGDLGNIRAKPKYPLN